MSEQQPQLTDHPRAERGIRRLRALAGLAGLVLVGLVSLRAGLPLFDVAARALAGGIVAHLVGWAFAIVLWRAIVQAEITAAAERRREALEAAAERARAAAAESA